MTRQEAIAILERLQEPEPYEPQITFDDYDALQMAIDALSQKKRGIGKWVHRNDDYNDWLECSQCGYGSEGEVKYGENTNYCPNCGADMRGKQDETDRC